MWFVKSGSVVVPESQEQEEPRIANHLGNRVKVILKAHRYMIIFKKLGYFRVILQDILEFLVLLSYT